MHIVKPMENKEQKNRVRPRKTTDIRCIEVRHAGARLYYFKVCIDPNDAVTVSTSVNGEPYDREKVIRNIGQEKFDRIVAKAVKEITSKPPS